MEFIEFDTDFLGGNPRWYSGFCGMLKWFCKSSSSNVGAPQQLQATPAAGIATPQLQLQQVNGIQASTLRQVR